MKKIDTDKIAGLLVKYLEISGFLCFFDKSSLSESKYVNAILREEDKEGFDVDVFDVKIRISNHELPPCYGSSTFNVGPKDQGWCHASWAWVVDKICTNAGKVTPSFVKGLLTKEENGTTGRKRKVKAVVPTKESLKNTAIREEIKKIAENCILAKKLRDAKRYDKNLKDAANVEFFAACKDSEILNSYGIEVTKDFSWISNTGKLVLVKFY